jgi:hypothetical protein
MSFPQAPFLQLASAAEAETDLPVFHAGSINDLATSARAVEEGHVDMVMAPNLHQVWIFAEGNHLVAVLRNECKLEEEDRITDQVVCEHGTIPCDELYFGLRPHSRNLGELDLDGLLGGRSQALVNTAGGTFHLFRVSDAVASRNIHAAIYDSLGLCKDF